MVRALPMSIDAGLREEFIRVDDISRLAGLQPLREIRNVPVEDDVHRSPLGLAVPVLHDGVFHW